MVPSQDGVTFLWQWKYLWYNWQVTASDWIITVKRITVFSCCSCMYASTSLLSVYSWIELPEIGKVFDTTQKWTCFSPYLKGNKVAGGRLLRAILTSTFRGHMSNYRSSSQLLYKRIVNHCVNIYVYIRSYW